MMPHCKTGIEDWSHTMQSIFYSMNKAAGIKLYFDVIFLLFLSLGSIFAFSGVYRPTLEKY